jgi:hypothetical protein
MNSELSIDIQSYSLSSVDRLALRCAIASLALLKQAAQELGTPVEELTGDRLAEWIQSTTN